MKYINMYGNLTFPQFLQLVVDQRSLLCPRYSSCRYNSHWLPYIAKGRLQQFMLGKLLDFSIKRVGGVSLVL